MFQKARQRLENLTQRRTDFAPPVASTEEGVRTDTLAMLRRWSAQSRDRFARFFLRERPLLATRRERELFRSLEQQGLAQRLGPSIYQPCVRLFPLYGRFIATDLSSYEEEDQVFSLMFEQVYFVRNMDVRPEDDVLELCVGSGVNSLFAGDVARTVTGVDVSPRAIRFAQFNGALNPCAGSFEVREGSLFQPLDADRRFDCVLVNPPFELVPHGESHFLHSDGGEDGLEVVRTLLDDAPRFLAPHGRLQIITWTPATSNGPVLVDLLREAFPASRIQLHVIDEQPIETHLEAFESSAHHAAWRERLADRGLVEVHFVFACVSDAGTPGVEIIRPEVEVNACDAIADAWTM